MNEWTPEEEKLVGKFRDSEVAKRLGRTIHAVAQRRKKLKRKAVRVRSIVAVRRPASPKSPHGGARRGAGRKVKPASEKRVMVSVKVFPSTNPKWADLAKKAGVSKGAVMDWLVGDSPEAEECRLKAVESIRRVARGLGVYFRP